MAAIDDAPRNNRFDPPTVARFWFFFSGVAITVNGFIFIGETFKSLTNCTGPNCVGPALRWGDWTGGNDDSQNVAWRVVFPLGPNTLFTLWTGVGLGLIMMICALPGFKFTFCTRTWLHVSFFSMFAVLFGAFPYSGNLGILVGFFVLPLSVLAFVLAFTKYRHEPTTLNLRVSHLHCGCLADNELFINITRIFSFAAGVGVFIAGLIHIIVQDFRWCPGGGSSECVGPSLRWNSNNQDFLQSVNGPGFGGWGAEIFTFAIDVFFPLWGPIVLGLVHIFQHIEGHQFMLISASWARVFFWMMFLGLFASMGYAGNIGILVGFFCILVALMAMLITFGGGATTRTHLEIRVKHCGSGKVTLVTAGLALPSNKLGLMDEEEVDLVDEIRSEVQLA